MPWCARIHQTNAPLTKLVEEAVVSRNHLAKKTPLVAMRDQLLTDTLDAAQEVIVIRPGSPQTAHKSLTRNSLESFARVSQSHQARRTHEARARHPVVTCISSSPDRDASGSASNVPLRLVIENTPGARLARDPLVPPFVPMRAAV